MRLKSRFGPFGYIGFFVLLTFYFMPARVFGADAGNCLVCHKYPGLSRVDENGEMRLLFVNEAQRLEGLAHDILLYTRSESLVAYPGLLPVLVDVPDEILRERLNVRGREDTVEIQARL